MKQSMHTNALIAFAALLVAVTPAAACVVERSIGELTQQADRIILGDVLTVTSAWNEDETLIITRIAVEPTDYLKGERQALEMVEFIGGTVGDISLVSSDTPYLRANDHLLLFLDANERLVGAYQGALLTDGTDAVRTDGGLGQFDESTLRPLADVLAEIEAASAPGDFPNAINPYAGDYRIPIGERYVPLPFDWSYMANPMGEDMETNGNCADASAGPPQNQWASLFFGAAEWNDAGADFEFTVGGFTTDTDDALDGRNLVFFCPSGSCGMAASTIAVTRLWFSGSDIVEWDMIFNDQDHEFWDGLTGACGGTRMDIHSIAAHEFGHALGLDHSADPDATMYATTSDCDLDFRSLHADDTAGLFAIYGPVVDPASYVMLGETLNDKFGDAVANAGDVDGDGDDDFIVGATLNDDGGLNAGKVYVYSGRTGAELYAKAGANANDRFGTSVAGVGDANGDGFDDFAVGAPAYSSSRGRVYVYSGANGAPLFARSGQASGDRFGTSVSGGVDVNDDGFDDVIIGAPNNDAAGTRAGRVYVHSGNTGTRLKILTGERRGDRFGWAVAAVGKMDGDGHGDFVVGAPRNDSGGSNSGRVYAYSGDDFDLMYTVNGMKKGDQFGRTLGGAGRVNSDGRDDFVAGAPYHDRGGLSNAGRFDVYSGRNGNRLWGSKGEAANDRLGWAVAGAGDVNDDGRADIIAGAPFNDVGGSNAGRVYIRSGTNAAIIGVVTGGAAGDQLGKAVGTIGDLDGDGADEVVYGAPYDDTADTNAGRVFIAVYAAAEFLGPLPNGMAVFAPLFDGGPAGPPQTSGGETPMDGEAPQCVADIDGSKTVDADDFAALLAAWGTCTDPCPPACSADLNGDCFVDGSDLGVLVQQWGQCE